MKTLGGIGTASVEEVSCSGMRVGIQTKRASYGVVRLPFAGEQQVPNALLAVCGAEHLLERVENIQSAFDETYMPGRFEIIMRSGKNIILDVAHNDAALSASADTLSRVSPGDSNAVVLGVMKRKELIHSPRRFLDVAGRVYLTAPEGGDAYSPQELLDTFRAQGIDRIGRDFVIWNGRDAASTWDRLVDTLLHPSTTFSTILVTGSHRTVESFGRRLLAKELE